MAEAQNKLNEETEGEAISGTPSTKFPLSSQRSPSKKSTSDKPKAIVSANGLLKSLDDSSAKKYLKEQVGEPDGSTSPVATPSDGAAVAASGRFSTRQAGFVAYMTMHQLLEEMRDQNLEAIRFEAYRTACKLRFIQRRSNVGLVDLWNVIEAFREFHLAQVDPDTTVPLNQLAQLLIIMFCDLNKRLPQRMAVEYSASTVLSWLVSTFDSNNSGSIPALSIKVALATLSRGRLSDKLKYIFSLISSSSPSSEPAPATLADQVLSSPSLSRKQGTKQSSASDFSPSSSSVVRRLIPARFDQFARIMAQMALALHSSRICCSDAPSEPPTQPTAELTGLAGHTFGQDRPTGCEFVHRMQSDAVPAVFQWLPTIHRIAAAENALHPVRCSACGRESFSGLCYHCDECTSPEINFCQECFWRGRPIALTQRPGGAQTQSIGHQHSAHHRLTEYTTYVLPSTSIAEHLRRSLACVPSRSGAVASGVGALSSPSHGGGDGAEQFEPIAAPTHSTADLRHIVYVFKAITFTLANRKAIIEGVFFAFRQPPMR